MGEARRVKRSPLRAVFDTNVVVSALVFGQRLSWLRHAWEEQRLIPLVCRETALELIRVLTYPKFRLDRSAREALLSEYLPYAETVILPDPLPALPRPCRDRDDAIFLQLAIAARAEVLVSGDRDLSVLSAWFPVTSVAVLRERLDAA